ncbi:MAG: 4Fe-4S binding protein [Candidatus Bipolaricaulaceae bacterium]
MHISKGKPMPWGEGTGPGWGKGRGRGRGRGRGIGRAFGSRMGLASVPKVNLEKYVGCGKCVEACPFGAITVKDGEAVENASLCRGCRVCARTCPTGAIS